MLLGVFTFPPIDELFRWKDIWFKDTFYAINNICSHAYAELSDGELDTDECSVTCPVHGSAFDLSTGRPNILPAFEPVASYRVSVQGDDILVDITDA